MQAAGAFSVVLEGIAEPLARSLSEALHHPHHRHWRIPCVRWAGAGDRGTCWACSASTKPRFVKRYAELQPQIEQALEHYAREVRSGEFPGLEHCFKAAP